MKVGILTFHRALNYGAVWQCWALIKICKKFGCQPYVIDYSPTGAWEYHDFSGLRIDKRLIKSKMLYRFNRFVDKLPKTQPYGDNHDAIVANPPILDAYIVGSDQMWSERLVGEHIGSFVFDFAPEKTRRISYAASLGGGFVGSSVFKKELKKFDAVSLREPDWKEQIEDVIGQEVEDVCDPSLLLCDEDYQKEEQRVLFLPKHYIAVFDLNNESFMKECALSLRKQLSLPLVSLSGNYKKWCDRNLLGISPGQWIYVLRHADFICTNSFHGTAFSIILRKPFVSVAANNMNKAVTDYRKRNILEQCGLQLQYIKEINQISNALQIDFTVVEDKIEHYKNRSLEWLKKALRK